MKLARWRSTPNARASSTERPGNRTSPSIGSPVPAVLAQAGQAFESLGWKVARRKGSHIILIKVGHIATLSVPDHEEVAKGTLRSLIRPAGLTVSEFIDILKD